MSTRVSFACVLGTLAVLCVLAFAPLAFGAGILGRGDTFTYFYPYWHARNAAFMSGALPLWAPELFAGVPLLANSQIGALYPPNWPLVVFSPPDGIRISIFLHLIWAAWGMAVLVRVHLGAGGAAAFAAGAAFALGGSVVTRIEQINQLQGLSWLPWVTLAFMTAARPDLPLHARVRPTVGLAAALALQFLTGHTQTLFMTLVTLGLVALEQAVSRAGAASLKRAAAALMRASLVLGAAGVLALSLTAPQWAATLELNALSNRSGGLNPDEATAFSLEPPLAARGLLPAYDRPALGDWLNGEFIAYIGVVGFGLLVFAAAARSRRPGRSLGFVLVAFGLFAAFGLWNPVYYGVLAHLPGFNLFRVPARWLAVFALGAAWLAAWAVEHIAREPAIAIARGRGAAAGLCALGLLAAAPLGVAVYNRALGPASTAAPVGASTLIGWGAAALSTAAALVLARVLARRFRATAGHWAAAVLAAALAIELMAAARAMPAHDLAPPEAYTSGRFTAHQLAVLTADEQPPRRVLSASNLFFDPGDRAALEARFAAEGWNASAVRNAFIAIKWKDVYGANYPLIGGVPSIDGFDGGLLPTAAYTAFTAPLLPADTPFGALRVVDGRLRERLIAPECGGLCLPDARWLDMLDVGYLVVDKTYDLWHEGVSYDTTFALSTGAAHTAAPVAPFTATALDLLIVPDSAAAPPTGLPRTLLVTLESGETRTLPVREAVPRASVGVYQRVRIAFDAPVRFASVTAGAGSPAVRAVTLIDARTDTFATTAPLPWRLALSSDIRLYARDREAAAGRAFVVFDARPAEDGPAGFETTLTAMTDPAFDPRTTAYIAGLPADAPTGPAPGDGRARIVDYAPTRIVIEAESSAPGWLILNEAWFPGWTAHIDGAPVPVYRANILMRAVPIPPGIHQILIEYSPNWLVPLFYLAGIMTALLSFLALGRAKSIR
jgi:hypothetical protein